MSGPGAALSSDWATRLGPLLVSIAMSLAACEPSMPEPAAVPPPVIDIGGEPAAIEQEPVPQSHAVREQPSAAALYDPSKANARAPERFQVRFETTEGRFIVELVRSWAPHGVDRLYNLVALGYFTDVAFFRVVRGFIVQFGIHGDPELNRIWHKATIPPDDVLQSNHRGFVSFAMAGRRDSRNVQLFINLKDNVNLDKMGFAPIGRVTKNMATVDAIYSDYGERAGRAQADIRTKGNAFLRQRFPELDYILSATIID